LNVEELIVLEKSLPNIYGNNIIFDGITDITEYNNTPIKILWILKEPNDPNKSSWDLRLLHKNVSKYSKWRRTYKLIIKISYAIINNIFKFEDIPNENEIKNILNNIAIINVNKVGGTSKSNDKIINDIYNKYKNTILQQIKYIEPIVIINCSRVNKIKEDLQNKIIQQKNIFSASFFNNGIIINAYHPNCRYKHNLYFNNIMEYINYFKISVRT
jgi:hypothetical protein